MTGVITVICRDLTVRTSPDDIAVVGRKGLAVWLTKQPEALTDDQVAAAFSVARRSTTWQ